MPRRKREEVEQQPGRMTVQEAGRKGGRKTAETHGREFYEEIGSKGGRKVQEEVRAYESAKGRGKDL